MSYWVLIIAKAYKLSWFLVGFTAGGVMGSKSGRVKMSRSHRDVFLSVAYFFKNFLMVDVNKWKVSKKLLEKNDGKNET